MANPTVQWNDDPKNFDDVLYQFEKAFRQGKNPDPASFAQCEGLDRVSLLMELLHSDLELRIRAGQTIRVSDYVTRYPEIRQRPEKLAAILETEIRLRGQMGKNPSLEEYEAVYREALGSRLRDIFNRLQVERETSQNAGKSTDTVEYKRAGPHQLPKHIGRFIILSLLGEGAFGRVYQARDPELEREVAIKVPRLAAGTADFDVNQFLREAKAAATISHPNVCPVYEAGVHEGQPYIVMAYIPGKSLAEVLQNRQPPPGKQVALIIRKLALALQAAHDKGVIHRDLKPSNILFDQYRKDVIVTDFGLARRDGLGDAQQTRSGVVMGTPAYMSPEQARGDSKQVGPAADIYSLGVILYELLAGQRPFTGSVGEVIGKVQHVDPVAPSKVRAEADPYLELICQKAMAKHPADRYSSMRALAETLTEYLHGIPPEPVAGQPNQAATTSQETTGFADLIAAALAEQKTEMSAALEAAVSKARIPLWKIMLPMGLLAVFGLVMLGLFLFTRPAVVMVTLPIDVDLKDKELSFFLDDKPIEAKKLAGPIELTEGPHILIVKRGETVIRRYEFNVKRGSNPLENFKDALAPHWPMSPGVPPATVHYTLDGQSQAMLNDARRRASVGKVVGNVQSVTGMISQAAGLEGKSDQYLEIQDTDALHITGLFTAAAWVNGKNDKATILSRWGADGYAFRLSTGVADGIEPKGDIAPAIMPSVPPPAPMQAPATKPPAAMLNPATMVVSTYTLTMPGQPPAGQPAVVVPTAPVKPTLPTNFKTNIIEFAVNFGPKDKEEGAVSVKATYDPESWTHVAATFDGHFLRLYLNGYLAAETCLADDPVMRKLMDEGKASLPASIASSKAPLVMGHGFAGQLDDVMLFDAALTDKELKRLIHFNTTRELATPPGQWVAFATEEADLAHARLTSKLGENVNFYGNALQLVNKAEVQIPFRAKNFVVKGTLRSVSKDGGIVRLRLDNGNAYGGYITGDGRFGLLKETKGQSSDLASNQFALTKFFTDRSRTLQVNGKSVPVINKVENNNPVAIALGVHGDRLAWFINGQPFLERKDDTHKAGSLSLSALDGSVIEIDSLQVCVLDGTPLTPEQALFQYKKRFAIKPEFTRLVALDAVNQTATFEQIVTAYETETYTYTDMEKRAVKKTKTELKTIDGRQVPTQVEYEETFEVPVSKQGTRTKPVYKSVYYIENIGGTRFTDARGNSIKLTDLVLRLQPGDACLTLLSDKLAPAYPYLIKAKPDTVVFLIQRLPLVAPVAMPANTKPPAGNVPIPAPPKVSEPKPAVPMVTEPKPAEPKPAVTHLTGHANPIQTVVHSPDGSQIATADGTFWKPGEMRSQLEAVNVNTGQTDHLFPSDGRCWPSSAAFSFDGKRMAFLKAGDTDFTLFDAENGKQLMKVPASKLGVSQVAYSNDGRRIATAGGLVMYNPQNLPPGVDLKKPPPGELKIWDAATGKLLLDVKGHTKPPERIAFSPDGRRLVSTEYPGILHIWDADTGDEINSIVSDEGNDIHGLAVSNKLVALACNGKGGSMIRLLNIETGAPIITIPANRATVEKGQGSTAYFSRIAFTSDGLKLLAIESQPVQPQPTGGTAPSKENAEPATGLIRIFDTDSAKELKKFDTEQIHPGLVASADGNHVATSGDDKTSKQSVVKVWDVGTGKLLGTIKGPCDLYGLKNGGGQLIVSRLVNVKPNHPPLSVKIWNASTGALIRSLEIPGNGIASIAYSGDGKRLAAGICTIDKSKQQSFVGELHVWDTATGDEIRKIQGIDGWIMAIALDQNGKRAVATSGLATKLWDVETGKELHTFPGGNRMAMDPAGKRLVVAGGFGPPSEAGKPALKSVRVFNCDDGKELPGLNGSGPVSGLAISHNGVVLATASPDGIRCWNLDTGKELRKYPANVGHLFFDNTGTLMVTDSCRSTFTIRDANTGAAKQRLRLNPKAPADIPPANQMFAMNFAYDARGIPMSLSHDGRTIAVVSLDGKSVQLKDVSSLEQAGNEDIAPEERVMENNPPPMPPAGQPVAPIEPAETKPGVSRPVGVLLNGSFEETGNGWTSTSWRGNTSVASIVSDISKSGKAVRLQAKVTDDAGYWQEVAVKPRTQYKLSGWVRTENVKVEEKGGTFGASISVKGGYETSPSSLGTTAWTLRSVSFNTGARTKLEIGARLGHYGSTVSGSAWFDDIKLEELPAHSK